MSITDHLFCTNKQFLTKKEKSSLKAMFFKVSSPQDTSVLSPGLHIGLVLTLAFIIFKKSSSQLFEHHPCLYILTFGTAIAKISNKLVVSFFNVRTSYTERSEEHSFFYTFRLLGGIKHPSCVWHQHTYVTTIISLCVVIFLIKPELRAKLVFNGNCSLSEKYIKQYIYTEWNKWN